MKLEFSKDIVVGEAAVDEREDQLDGLEIKLSKEEL